VVVYPTGGDAELVLRSYPWQVWPTPEQIKWAYHAPIVEVLAWMRLFNICG
jgi:hypothetical protein